MFIRVCVRVAADVVVKSNIVVEFKLPPGSDRIYQAPSPLPSASSYEELAFYADFPSSGFESALDQAYIYACDRSKDPQGVTHINKRYAFVSTFNGLWVLQMVGKNSNNNSNDGSDSINSNDGGSSSSEGNDSSSHNKVLVSPCFVANNTTPHVSFAVAYVLHLVIEDMMAKPEDCVPPFYLLLF